ncbi:uncharacterized protein AC631_04801 [Debaryomyces fabryi]|uniref:SAC3/GANP/THP3 conserved domain-containing protein n=1 Tax=Debaryomyces fabryi TaxID=58627 RepID=A0A0V1PT79_9ASCO|nr:uncharacterized protein AC631_04801 [Debaryomyces fabryi]KRZ99434.1 hypothetical protein AC631_04801 [Debaryomyces fabryi]CUM46601.1 unnamed protein product [Debaryomyces fabryi]
MGGTYNEVTPSLTLGKNNLNISSKSSSSSQNPASSTSNSGQTNIKSQEAGQNWPPSLQEFVNTSFIRSSLLSNADKITFNTQLQSLMEKALSTGKIWENDWKSQKIPILDKSCKKLELECLTKKPRVKNQEQTPTSTVFLPPPKRQKTKKKQMTTDTLRSTLPATPNISNKSANTELAGLKGGKDSEFNSAEKKKQRMARFGAESLTPEPFKRTSETSSTKVIIGKCEDLEKHYLRLTSEPDPYRVRPQRVLEKSVKFILDKYKKDSQTGYSYVNNQFKSIRQDLTVQHIKNDFAMQVYETHARIAIENNDLGEFNQCQSQLKYLYYLKKKSDKALSNNVYTVELEFTCYRIIYMLMMGNYSEIYKLKLELCSNTPKPKGKKQIELLDCIEKAFLLQSYQINGDYHKFFNTYDYFKSIPSMKLAAHLIKHFLVSKERIKSLNIIAKSYRKLPISFMVEELKLTNKTEDDIDNWNTFLTKYNLLQFLVLDTDFDCSASRGVLQNIVVQNGFRKIDIKGQV